MMGFIPNVVVNIGTFFFGPTSRRPLLGEKLKDDLCSPPVFGVGMIPIGLANMNLHYRMGGLLC